MCWSAFHGLRRLRLALLVVGMVFGTAQSQLTIRFFFYSYVLEVLDLDLDQRFGLAVVTLEGAALSRLEGAAHRLADGSNHIPEETTNYEVRVFWQNLSSTVPVRSEFSRQDELKQQVAELAVPKLKSAIRAVAKTN